MTQTLLSRSQIDTGLLGNAGVNGPKWPGSTITFSIPGPGASWVAGYGRGEPTDPAYSTLDAGQGANFAAAISLWDGYIGNTFQSVSDSTPGDIRVAFTNVVSRASGAYAYAYGPPSGGTLPVTGDIWIDQGNNGATFGQGSYDFQALLHEVGHALGLKHSFEPPVLPPDANGKSYDSYAYTLMSYTPTDYLKTVNIVRGGNTTGFSSSDEAVTDRTPMVLDIQAIQDLYTADLGTRTGNDTYVFTDALLTSRQTIYDAGGVDTLDLSQLSRGSNVDLRSGAYSDLAYYSVADQRAAALAASGGLFAQQIDQVYNDPSRPAYTWSNNLGIAFGVTIENVIGSAQVDTVIGNAAANVLTGGGGADVFTGGGGADIYRDTAANLNGDTVNDFILAAVVNVSNAVGALAGLSYSGTVLSFSLATAPTTTYTMNLLGGAVSGLTPQQRAGAAGGVDIYFGNAPATPSYSIAVSPASVLEGDSGTGASMVYTVTRTGGTAAATVDVTLTGTATAPGTAGADYAVTGLANGKLAFAAGAASAQFTVTTVPDVTVEPNETVIATLANATDGGTFATATATGTITDDDASAPPTSYSIAVSPASVQEGNAGTGNSLLYTVTRTGQATAAASIAVALTGTATNGQDYSVTGLAGGQLAFAAGATTATFTVTTVPDTAVEPDETVIATISNAPNGGLIGTAQATGTILNDDAAAPAGGTYSITVAPASVAEGNAGTGNSLVYTVTRTGGTAAASIAVALTGTATNGQDYGVTGLSGGQLAFAAGATTATFTVTTVPDTAVEPDETVIATISNAPNGGTIGTAQATGTIRNDDAAAPADTTADAGEPARIAADGTRNGIVDLYESRMVSFAVTGLDADATAVATFTDGTRSATANVAANGTFTIDLSRLDGTVQSSLAIRDTSGNTATGAGNAISVDVDAFQGLFGTVAKDASGAGGQVYELYQGLLGRAPDAAGFEFQLEALSRGATLAQVAASIVASPEYTAKNGPASAESNAGFVSELYQVVLGRSGDQKGVSDWLGALAGGATRGDVAVGFALSPENLAQDAGVLGQGVFVPDPVASDVARLYYAILDRAPDAGGLQFSTGLAKGGLSTLALADAFLRSPEYASNFGTPSNAAFITALYDGALGRQPDPQGFADALAALESGRSRAAVALGIADSPEANAFHQVEIENGWHVI